MTEAIQAGDMVFIADGTDGVAAVRSVTSGGLVIYVENSGEFDIPLSAVQAVHSGKVVLTKALLPHAFLQAIGHAHDREDPNLVG